MAAELRIPSLGESISEGTIVQWLKADGARVGPDDPVLELETDKASMEIPAGAAGVLRIVKQQGETVTVGDVVARIEDGDGRAAAPAPRATPSAAPAAPEPNLEAASEQDTIAPRAEAVATLPPSVRKLVTEHQLDPTTIPATGKGGRLTKDDVVTYVERQGREAAAPAPSATPPPTLASVRPAPAPVPPRSPRPASDEGEERVKLSPIRKRIAERLVQAQHTAAILTTFNEVDMQAVIDLRAHMKERFQQVHGVGLGFMSFFARATVMALRDFPVVNAEIRGDEVVYKHYVHLGIAVGSGRGLVVPVLHHAERMSFADIEREIGRLAGLARDGKLSLDDLSGGTFTISNGGVYGSLMSTPILNPPQSGILGMHKIEKRPVVVDDQIVVRPMMYLALSYDHRLVDGEQAVSFLVRVKERIEEPARLLLDV
jgi:2-oxoglutarate dehydrogenase E2 component (dihydrolipoamide succinyltransferase)